MNAQEIEWMADCVREVWRKRLEAQIAKAKAEDHPDLEPLEQLLRALDYL